MKLKELLQHVFDNICVYEEIALGEYKDIYKGDALNIPVSLLERDVRFVGAKRKI